MNQKRYDLINQKYSEFLEKVFLLKKEKLAIIAKYRKRVDEKKLKNLREVNEEGIL